ncbi:MAG: peptidoglycan D,D-transpeptidase FtsI family protein [bacterium]
MTARIRQLVRLFVVLFIVEWAWVAYWQMGRGPELALDPRNPRMIAAEQRIHRGAILDRMLRPLALTPAGGEQGLRQYPYGPLFAHTIGYRSLRAGKAGLERALDAHLLGLKLGQGGYREVLGERLGPSRRGADVVLTLDAQVQQAAWEALGGRRGAVVVLDPRTGAILALASAPSFDPGGVDADWDALRETSGGPLLNRALQGQYPPGSAFKVVTMAAALSRGIVSPNSVFADPGSIIVGKTRITNYEGRACGSVTVFTALVHSCNVVFIKVGMRLGGEALLEAARGFGLGEAASLEVPASAGHLPPSDQVRGDGVAQMAFGQGSLAVSPLQMALVAATFARRGTMPIPYLVREVRTPDGEIMEQHRSAHGKSVIATETAEVVTEAMIEVVRRGTGQAARLPRVVVAGKTGTATAPVGRSHAWFIGFAPAQAPRVAVAVVLEHGGVGGQNAAPVARRVLQAALAAVEE